MEQGGVQPPYQPFGVEGGSPASGKSSKQGPRLHGTAQNGHHHGSQLYQQTRGHQVSLPLSGDRAPVELGPEPPSQAEGSALSGERQHPGRCCEQGSGRSPRMVIAPSGGSRHLCSLGRADCRPLCFCSKHKSPQVLVPEGRTTSIEFRRPLQQVACGPPLRFPSDSSLPSGDSETQEQGRTDDPHCTPLAPSALVPGLAEPAAGTGSSPPILGHSLIPERRESVAPKPAVSEPPCLDPEERDVDLVGMSQGIRDTLLGSRKGSTRRTYNLKWKRFASWCAGRQLGPFVCSVNKVLEYLLSLSEGGLQTSSVRVHLAAISAFHSRVEGSSLMQLHVVKHFLKGLLLAKSPLKWPLAQWDINLVLARLMESPFEPAESMELRLLSWKTLFLVAITSTRRISELQALVVQEPFYPLPQRQGSAEDAPLVFAEGCLRFPYQSGDLPSSILSWAALV
ncbi:mitochondrial import receptor subunit TOM5 homolog isoform X2 [Latimeria chalumnae]|uniref:mitochondrial import receptor subunit TOM5 homolog isoform X2 n=1 Tax=Latimeria chalumnae TaxID=7897 RepID=UPI00313C708D